MRATASGVSTSRRQAAPWLRWLVAAAASMAASAWAGALPGELPRTVGSLTTLQGDVRWLDRDSGQWQGGASSQPLRNWPVVAGDHLRTGPDGRAEVRVGANTLRLGPSSDVTLSRLDDKGLVVHLQSGVLAVRLASPDANDLAVPEVVTPEGRWLMQRPGHYRLERLLYARPLASQASVWRGSLQFVGSDSALPIPEGRRADIWIDPGQAGSPRITRFAWENIERDGFADWVAREDRLDDSSQSARHVPPGISGTQVLDRYGEWVTVPEVGMVWQPRDVAVGWAPYQVGSWAWVSPWGWTWVDASPWGFAPFHYGSWLMWQGRWVWSPGARHERAVYMPVHPGWSEHHDHDRGVVPSRHSEPPRMVMPPPAWVHRHDAPNPALDRRPDGRRDEDRRDERRDERREERRDPRRDGDAARPPQAGSTPQRPDAPRAHEPNGPQAQRPDAPRLAPPAVQLPQPPQGAVPQGPQQPQRMEGQRPEGPRVDATRPDAPHMEVPRRSPRAAIPEGQGPVAPAPQAAQPIAPPAPVVRPPQEHRGPERAADRPAEPQRKPEAREGKDEPRKHDASRPERERAV
jgi:hypothetical protein